jgi:hypothetical protein
MFVCEKCNTAIEKRAPVFAAAREKCKQGHWMRPIYTPWGSALMTFIATPVLLIAVRFGMLQFAHVDVHWVPAALMCLVALWALYHGINLSRRPGPIHLIGRDWVGWSIGMLVGISVSLFASQFLKEI